MVSVGESSGIFSKTVRTWWQERSRRDGLVSATRQLGALIWEFLRDSTPERRRGRYGDLDYDWDHRVNTTGGTVGWRERLLGLFLSPYQATEPAVFQEMMAALPIDFREFTFVDLGSGKGRTLLMASEYPFRRVIGVEIIPELHRAAEMNVRDYQSATQRCRRLEPVCADAREFVLPEEPLVLYLFNPLPEAGLKEVAENLTHSLTRSPRPVYVVYHNPLLEQLLSGNPVLRKVEHTTQYSIYAFTGSADC